MCPVAEGPRCGGCRGCSAALLGLPFSLHALASTHHTDLLSNTHRTTLPSAPSPGLPTEHRVEEWVTHGLPHTPTPAYHQHPFNNPPVRTLSYARQDHRVEEWVTHGLNLPQYASAFKANAITALDFPFLAADGGAALEADLGVASKLHQQQVRWWWCVWCGVVGGWVGWGWDGGGGGGMRGKDRRRRAPLRAPHWPASLQLA